MRNIGGLCARNPHACVAEECIPDQRWSQCINSDQHWTIPFCEKKNTKSDPATFRPPMYSGSEETHAHQVTSSDRGVVSGPLVIVILKEEIGNRCVAMKIQKRSDL